jgi:plastocyanin
MTDLRWTAWLFVLVLTLMGCRTESQGPKTSTEVEGKPHFVLLAKMTGYYGVGEEIAGKKNPVLYVKQGDEVTITIINGESMAHDIVLDGHGARSEILIRKSETTTVTFIAKTDDTYYCSIPGHVTAGMIGRLVVVEAPEQNKEVLQASSS